MPSRKQRQRRRWRKKRNATRAKKSQLENMEPKPQVTLLDLPTELRIMVYEHILADSMAHLDTRLVVGQGTHRFLDFTWRACLSPDAECPMLCIDNDRCHRNEMGTFPFLLISRQIHQEIKSMVLSHVGISVHAPYFQEFVRHSPPSLLQSRRRLTLHGYGMNRAIWPTYDLAPYMGEIFRLLPRFLPQLEAVGLESRNGDAMMGMWHSSSGTYERRYQRCFREHGPVFTYPNILEIDSFLECYGITVFDSDKIVVVDRVLKEGEDFSRIWTRSVYFTHWNRIGR